MNRQQLNRSARREPPPASAAPMAKYSGAEVKQLAYDLTRTGGLALVGHFLKTIAPAPADVDRRA